MGALSSKLRFGEDGYLVFHCPGCDYSHGIKTGSGTGPRWHWNENAERPTFRPSIVVRSIKLDLSEELEKQYDELVETPGGMDKARADLRFLSLCHSFVTDGQIQFLSDSTHFLQGQTVALPDSHKKD
jgi:Family of unknown function (DUF6527)